MGNTEMKRIRIDETIDIEDLFGNLDSNLRLIKEAT